MNHKPEPTNSEDTEPNTDKQSRILQHFRRHRFKYVTSVLCIIALAMLLLIMAGYFAVNIGREQEHQIHYLNHQIKHLKHHQQKMSHQPDQNSQAIQHIQKDLQQQQKTLKQLQKQLSQRQHQTQLNRIRHWVRSAIVQLQTKRDRDNALTFLKQAQQTAYDIDTPQANDLQQALTNSITKLESVASVDTQPIYHQLRAIQIQAHKLAFVPDQFTGKLNQQYDNLLKHKASPQNDADKTWWQRLWQKITHPLSKILVIEHHQQQAQPLLPDTAKGLIKLNIDQALSQAQWALLQQNPSVYHHNLQRTKKLLQTYYSPSDRRKALTKHIDDLYQKTIRPQLPNINHLLQQVPHSLDEVQS